MLVQDLFENRMHDAYSVFQQLASAVHNSQDVDLKIGHEMMPIQAWQARFLLGQYKSLAKRQGPDAAMRFLADYNAITAALDAMDSRLAQMKRMPGSLPGQRGVAEGNLNEFDPSGFNGGGDGESERSRRLRKLLKIAIEAAEKHKVGSMDKILAMNTIAGDDFFSIAVEGILPDITDREYMYVIESAYKTVKQGVAEGYEDDDNECYTCRGTGEGQHEGASCPSCGGSGIVRPTRDDDNFDIPDDMDEGAIEPKNLQRYHAVDTGRWPDDSNSLADRTIEIPNIDAVRAGTAAPNKHFQSTPFRTNGVKIATKVKPSITKTTVDRLDRNTTVPDFLKKSTTKEDARPGPLERTAKHTQKKTVDQLAHLQALNGLEETVNLMRAANRRISENLSLMEFDPRGFNGGGDGGGGQGPNYEKLRQLASRWWHAKTEQQRLYAEGDLEALGYEIHELETGQQGVQLTPYGDYTIEDVVTFLVDDLYEAANAAQQAAIAINMKKHHKKPKSEGVAEGSLDKYKKYTRPVVKTTPKIERTTNPAGRTTDHVEWKVTSPTGEIHRYNSKKQAQAHFDSFSKQGVAEEKVRLDPKCWTGKHIGNPATKVKGGVRVNNCVPNESMDEDYNKGMKMADYVAQADRLHDEMMRCQHENDQTGYERAKQAYLELERQARQGMVPETAGTTAATMPPSPAAAAQAKAIVQKAADDRAISLANVARVVPNNVAEASGAWPFADINEVSDATLTSYKQKAHKSAEQLSAAGQHRAATDRYGNIMKATGKQIDRTTKNIARALAKK